MKRSLRSEYFLNDLVFRPFSVITVRQQTYTYMNNTVKPYVYRCEHKITKAFYFGYRFANTVQSHLDLGIHYFTSSSVIAPDFVNYTYEILSEYDTAEWAYETEQRLIFENRHNPLLLNKNWKKKNLIALNPKPVKKYKSVSGHRKYNCEPMSISQLIENKRREIERIRNRAISPGKKVSKLKKLIRELNILLDS